MKRYSPTFLEALGESLRTAYWYQKDLRSFLIRAGVPTDVVNVLPWGQHWYQKDLRSFLIRAGVPTDVVSVLPWGQQGVYKRSIARQFIDRLASESSKGMPVLSRLVDSLVELDEQFPHLLDLEDGKRKADEARQALRHLKDLLGKETVAERAERARKEARTESERIREQTV